MENKDGDSKESEFLHYRKIKILQKNFPNQNYHIWQADSLFRWGDKWLRIRVYQKDSQKTDPLSTLPQVFCRDSSDGNSGIRMALMSSWLPPSRKAFRDPCHNIFPVRLRKPVSVHQREKSLGVESKQMRTTNLVPVITVGPNVRCSVMLQNCRETASADVEQSLLWCSPWPP